MGFFKTVGGIVLLVVVIIAMSAGGWAWRYYTAPIEGRVAAEEQIESANSRIANYEHFFDLCVVAQTRQEALSVQQSLLESAESDKERARIRANVAGLEAQLSRAVNQYNVDVQKSYTMARFKSADLPYELNKNQSIICR